MKESPKSNSTENIKLENFDIQREFETLLNHSQDIMHQYDTLIYRIQSVIDETDSPINLAFYDLIDAYYLKIENKRRAINLFGKKIRVFNKIYNVDKTLNKS